MVSAISRARMFNQAMGGAFVLPWEVDDIPEEWSEMIYAMTFDLPKYKETYNQVEARAAEWRNSHPTYRK